MDNKFRTRKNVFEVHNTEWETFEHTYHHLALECQILGGNTEFSSIVRADQDLTIFIIK